MSISPALDIARRALVAHDTALTVTGNNIANVQTPGYSRQVAEYEEDASFPNREGLILGTGVHIGRVAQVVDPLLERRRLLAQADRGEQSARRDQLEALAGVANDLSEPSLSSVLDGFFDAADGLARNPEGLAEREGLLGAARPVAGEVNRRSADIATLQRDVDNQVVQAADAADAALQQIATLNRHIAAIESTGEDANQLRDQRQSLLTEVGKTIAIVTLEDPHGAVSVSAAAGPVLVDGGSVVYDIVTRTGPTGLDGNALHDVGLAASGGAFLTVPTAFERGALAGLIDVRDDALVTASTNLDRFAGALRDAVNAIQTDAAARDLDGGATTTAPIFSGTGAADLAVALTDPRRIAAARSTQAGDNQNALLLADLRTTAPVTVAPASTDAVALGSNTLGGFLAVENGRIGSDATVASKAADGAERLGEQLDALHASVSGVNLNEELTNLLKTQRAFQAAARLFTVTNGILDDLLHVL